jgi:hypothetical protein
MREVSSETDLERRRLFPLDIGVPRQVVAARCEETDLERRRPFPEGNGSAAMKSRRSRGKPTSSDPPSGGVRDAP